MNIIGICDHNSTENAQATMQAAAGESLTVLPGIEITTIEEVHVIALFRTTEDAVKIQDIVYHHLPGMKNDPELFGDPEGFEQGVFREFVGMFSRAVFQHAGGDDDGAAVIEERSARLGAHGAVEIKCVPACSEGIEIEMGGIRTAFVIVGAAAHGEKIFEADGFLAAVQVFDVLRTDFWKKIQHFLVDTFEFSLLHGDAHEG